MISKAASLLHRYTLFGSENCFHPAQTQDYFVLEKWGARPIVGHMANPGESSIAHLTAQHGVQRVPSPKLELVQRRGFLTPEHCGQLIELIDAGRRPSEIADPNGDDYFRTSETCDLPGDAAPVRELEQLLEPFTGIDPKFGEPVQGQRYAVGQEFKQHTDYFEPGGEDFTKFCSVAGQRTWTFMIYLNEVEAGGGTRFKVIGKTFHPEVGKLLGWNNHRADGSLNPATLHHGMKVRKGVKYVITKWYREKVWG